MPLLRPLLFFATVLAVMAAIGLAPAHARADSAPSGLEAPHNRGDRALDK